MTGRTGERIVDATLAVLALAAALAIAAAGHLDPSVPWILVGGVGTVAVEVLLLRHRDRVRAIWERPRVRYGTTAVTIVLVAVAVAVGATPVLWIVVGGLAGYLAVLGLATVVDGTGRDA